MQFFKEWAYVDRFVRHCDAVGLPIPNDSPGFRDKYLSQNNLLSPDMRTMDWPPREMQGLLALGQHYGLPTRLLDWSTRSYVAAYFALSDAIRIITQGASSPKSRLAVWILDCEQSNHFKELDVLAVPGGSNANLAAQSGRFTLLKQLGGWATPCEGETRLDVYFSEHVLPAPLKKVTLPFAEVGESMRLCGLYGLTGATMFPDYYGSARAAEDELSAPPVPGSLSLWRDTQLVRKNPC
jgi:hypothetical protein